MTYYNELRGNWTFPYKANEILESIERQIKRQALLYTEAWDDQKHHEHELAQYREKIRQAGVEGWEYAKMPPKESSSLNSPKQSFLMAKRSHKKKIDELILLKTIMLHQCNLDKHRMFKLTPKDVQFFGLDKKEEQ